jgi:hypothetical protein
MKTAIFCADAFASSLAGQVLVAERGLPPGKPVWQRVKVAGRGFLGDSFRMGGQKVLFSLRATVRPKAACPLAASWSLAAAPVSAGDRQAD